MTVEISVSFGEYFDRLSILKLKALRVQAPEKRAKAEHQLAQLRNVSGAPDPSRVESEVEALFQTNAALWDIENRIRAQIDAVEFAELARKIQFMNGERARLKAVIDRRLDCALSEVKEYEDNNG